MVGGLADYIHSFAELLLLESAQTSMAVMQRAKSQV